MKYLFTYHQTLQKIEGWLAGKQDVSLKIQGGKKIEAGWLGGLNHSMDLTQASYNSGKRKHSDITTIIDKDDEEDDDEEEIVQAQKKEKK